MVCGMMQVVRNAFLQPGKNQRAALGRSKGFFGPDALLPTEVFRRGLRMTEFFNI
jgi:hypothetical protein